MVSRERILEAAARVYAKHGFKGATTRLIANEAGVNEVTLFRTFGSKGALLEAVLIQYVSKLEVPTLPDVPVDPREELRDFIEHHLRMMAEIRPLLMHSISELDNRPEAHDFACRGKQQAHDMITTYLRHLQQNGRADRDIDVHVAALMLTGTVFADAMGRAVMPALYPPLEQVADRYTSLFLRAVGVREKIGDPEQAPASEARRPARSAGPAVRTPNTPSRTNS